MTVNLTGLIENAAAALPKRASLSAYGLRELLGNLKELRDRREEGTAVIDEFFAFYQIDSKEGK